jgi:peptidoglycan/xylan/chitin deacetylase (PgdA/CDA1 family)
LEASGLKRFNDSGLSAIRPAVDNSAFLVKGMSNILGPIRYKLKLRTRLRSALHRIQPPAPKPLILMYHRIADPAADPWGLAVSPANFEEHLCVLRRTRHPFSLVEFMDRLTLGKLPSNAVALTFDDGYLDNLVVGKPLLAAADMPATVFLATGFIGRHEAFWWDELAAFILLAKAPKAFELMVGNFSLCFDFAAKVTGGSNAATPVDPAKQRAGVLSAIWEALQQLDDEGRRLAMTRLRLIFMLSGDQRARLGRPMTSHEVRLIASDRLVTIGAHTVTHPILSRLPFAACRHEIADSKLTCEDLIGSTVTAFSYPYGEFNFEAREAVRTAGFAIAVSIRKAPVTVVSDVLAMPRVHVRNLNGDAFEWVLHSMSAAH